MFFGGGIPMTERWYSMAEICDYLGVSRFTVLNWIEKKQMPACKVGRLWKFKINEIDEWMKRNTESHDSKKAE